MPWSAWALLFDGAGNEALRSTASSLNARVTFMRSLSLSLTGRPAESIAELRAIMDGDADRAALVCGNHVDRARIAAMRALDEVSKKVS